MELDFDVNTHREGTIDTNDTIESIINKMACDCFTNRITGSVVAVVEKTGGEITKNKLKWGEDNDPKFQSILQRNADTLLLEVLSRVKGGGNDPEELRVKIVVKK
ncbi:MAG: hypothetical protein H6582_05855 [Crocinitomicaceae bacterium]|nr:hypothetical protein [Crocinitomicaceae bacterium]